MIHRLRSDNPPFNSVHSIKKKQVPACTEHKETVSLQLKNKRHSFTESVTYSKENEAHDMEHTALIDLEAATIIKSTLIDHSTCYEDKLRKILLDAHIVN